MVCVTERVFEAPGIAVCKGFKKMAHPSVASAAS